MKIKVESNEKVFFSKLNFSDLGENERLKI